MAIGKLTYDYYDTGTVTTESQTTTTGGLDSWYYKQWMQPCCSCHCHCSRPAYYPYWQVDYPPTITWSAGDTVNITSVTY